MKTILIAILQFRTRPPDALQVISELLEATAEVDEFHGKMVASPVDIQPNLDVLDEVDRCFKS